MAGATVRAQELEPRAYSPGPVGLNFLVLGYTQSTGSVLFDASSPIENVDAHWNAGASGYGRNFALFGRYANAVLVVPYVWGDISGEVGETQREVHRSGFADPRFRLGINLLGGEPLTVEQFARRQPRTTLGASITVAPPLGEYDSSKLINLGSNRWAFKPELGLSHPIGRWYLDAYLGVVFFTDNERYFGGVRREQDPVSTFQAHVSYTFRPRLWLAADATYYHGGRTTVDHRLKADLQSNSRVGMTLSIPIGTRQSIKLAWSDGATTRIGSDFSNVGVAWQYTWFD